MIKKINISDLPKHIQGGIIKVIPTAKYIGYEGESMSKITNEMILKELRSFKQEVLTRLDRIESTPTMKKELKK